MLLEILCIFETENAARCHVNATPAPARIHVRTEGSVRLILGNKKTEIGREKRKKLLVYSAKMEEKSISKNGARLGAG